MHALLSASSSERWLHCPPSARLEEGFPDTTSPSAAEGTLAHAMAELKVRRYALEPISTRAYNTSIKNMKEDPLYQKEMDGHTDAYLEYIKELMLFYHGTKPYVQVEKRVSYTAYAKEGFGTADCIILADRDLHIVDFKYGRHNFVSAEDNSQLKLYALGVVDEYSLFYDIQTVHMHIFQPRMDNVGRDAISIADLRAWGESIKPIAEMAYLGLGEQDYDEELCKFCRAKSICTSRADKNLVQAQHDFKKPPLLSHAEVGGILKKAEDLAKWASDLKDWALSEVLKGADVPGWKAVPGRTSRSFTDQDAAFSVLVSSGMDENMLYERKPLTLAAVETLITKKVFQEQLSDYVKVSPGKPTLVDQSDKREAISKATAQEDFGIQGGY